MGINVDLIGSTKITDLEKKISNVLQSYDITKDNLIKIEHNHSQDADGIPFYTVMIVWDDSETAATKYDL